MPLVQNQAASEANIFAEIRAGFEAVSEQARHVRIRYDLLDDYANSLPLRPKTDVLDTNHHFTGDAESTAAYILFLDSINFGSGYEPDLVGEGWEKVDNSLYYTIATRSKLYFENAGIPGASMLQKITPEKCADILELSQNGPQSMAFAELCATSLQELGTMIGTEYEGSFLSFVRTARGRASNLVRQMISMHGFNDVHAYHGHQIPFYKRAQITAADMHIAFERLGEKLFSDMDQITMFPDNGVPHVLHTDGILDYTPELAARIDAGEEIPSGSEEEIELRGCAGHVVELLAQRKGLNAVAIDHILWHMSAEDMRYTESHPHRTRSRFY